MRIKAKFYTLIALVLSLLFCSQAWADESDLVWSTFLGGIGQDIGMEFVVDESGNAYVIGQTSSGDFPTTAGAYDCSFNGGITYGDAFVAKLNQTGSVLECATYLGGTSEDAGLGVALDSSGNVYLTGHTDSQNFPVTAGAYDTSHNGFHDVFVAKLNPAVSVLDYPTFLGGSADEWGFRMAVDNSGNAHVTGHTESANFPATSGAFDTTHNGWRDVFVAKLNPTGSILEYATFLGGGSYERGEGIALDVSGNAYVAGYTVSSDFPTTAGAYDRTFNGGITFGDAFVAKLNQTGSVLECATYLGGTSEDAGLGVALDGSGNVYMTGGTTSSDFPTTAGACDTTYNGDSDVFVAKLNLSNSTLDYSTFLGGSAEEYGWDIALDDSGNVHLTGQTGSGDFPTTAGAFRTTYNGGNWDVFVAKLDWSISTLGYSTFLGGGSDEYGYGIARDGSDYSYVTGYTASSDFPVTAGAFDETYNGQDDAFVAKLSLVTPVESETPGTELPKTCVLHQNYPNPFNAITEIRYQIPEDSQVVLKVFNTLGQEVQTLVDARREAGEYAVTWDGQNDVGREVASGVYFCRLRAGNFHKTVKMVHLK